MQGSQHPSQAPLQLYELISIDMHVDVFEFKASLSTQYSTLQDHARLVVFINLLFTEMTEAWEHERVHIHRFAQAV